MSEENRVWEIFNMDQVIAEFPPDPTSAAKRRAELLVKSDTLRVVLITALKGSKLNEHNAPGPITIQVVHGEFVLSLEGENRAMQQGDIAIIGPEILHELECIEDGAILLTIAHLSHVPDQGGES